MRGFVLVGLIAVVAGGLVAAVTGPTGLAAGSWMAAYLVLVAGVAQAGLGVGQALLAAVPPSAPRTGRQLVLYNAAGIAVLIGTVTEAVLVVVAGGAMLFAALCHFLAAARRPRTHAWYLAVYRALLAVLGVSIPVGLVLSAVRHG
ncbi:hypothetical protein HIR71_01750 [Cellulomonas fimi]|uniref:Uncharacterized protein n=2 Tax=Cellulomonas fimi TaxID=1708 RepID=A0A7Y0QGJ8_CELFI|nr:hypothetical protein [Cellulomonas fimi]